MKFFHTFLSVVFIVRNQSNLLEEIISDAAIVISPLVRDYEFIIVDNSSYDDSISVLKKLTDVNGQPNLQVYALSKEVDKDTAAWVGIENALGNFIAIIDPFLDDIHFLPEMLDKVANGADVVFAHNQEKISQKFVYQIGHIIFNKLYKYFNKIDLDKDAPQYRILSKKVVNFILQHPQPARSYRHLPATGGFSRVNFNYRGIPKASYTKGLVESIDRGIRLLISTTRIPMRIVTSLSLFGAITNGLYSVYVVTIFLFKEDVAPGWISLSFQQSGMFFLISIVLFVLGEYILHMNSLSNEGPSHYIVQEFMSSRVTRHEKLNIEEFSVQDIQMQ